VCYMPYPSHPPRFDHPTSINIWRWMQIMNLTIKQFSASSLLLLHHLKSKHFYH
jgi:hypothetical protein